MQTFIKRHRILLLHLSFWCVYFSFFFYQIRFPIRGQEVSFLDAFKNTSFEVLFMMLVVYLNYFFFLPRFLNHKSLLRYILEFSIPFAVLVRAFILLKRYLIDGNTQKICYFYEDKFTVNVVLSTLFIVVFVGMLKFAEGWLELEAKTKEIENERLTSELRFLKAQINPHFLFNTLNNLYYLAFTHSPNTTEVIAKLSQMMRYMIYDSNHAKVPLSKEIEYMKNYISLEKLRLNEPIPIHFEITGNTNGILIVPLIFISFLENAFKHGVSNNFSGAWITADIVLEGTACIYTVANSRLPDNLMNKEEQSGIGLNNVKRRLELSYPDNFELEIEDKADEYRVRLKLNLV
ncbi:MAG: histidine kinase [Spirosomataceae bacterium]